MTTRICTSAVIDAPIEKVWAKVRDFNNLPEWHPKFSRSHIEGGLPSDQVGCVRNFDIAGGGGTIRERLLALSDTEHYFRYCILTSPLPVKDYVAQLTLYPVTMGNKTFGIWIAECKVTNGDEAGVVDAVGNGTFGKAFEVLNQLLAREGASTPSGAGIRHRLTKQQPVNFRVDVAPGKNETAICVGVGEAF
jgi:hypothetical protein